MVLTLIKNFSFVEDLVELMKIKATEYKKMFSNHGLISEKALIP